MEVEAAVVVVITLAAAALADVMGAGATKEGLLLFLHLSLLPPLPSPPSPLAALSPFVTQYAWCGVRAPLMFNGAQLNG